MAQLESLHFQKWHGLHNVFVVRHFLFIYFLFNPFTADPDKALHFAILV